jgi:hypothetical protein
MMTRKDRTVSQRPSGAWANKRDGTVRAASLHETQEDAMHAAREMLHRNGGGELKVKGEDGKIRLKDTVDGE